MLDEGFAVKVYTEDGKYLDYYEGESMSDVIIWLASLDALRAYKIRVEDDSRFGLWLHISREEVD